MNWIDIREKKPNKNDIVVVTALDRERYERAKRLLDSRYKEPVEWCDFLVACYREITQMEVNKGGSLYGRGYDDKVGEMVFSPMFITTLRFIEEKYDIKLWYSLETGVDRLKVGGSIEEVNRFEMMEFE